MRGLVGCLLVLLLVNGLSGCSPLVGIYLIQSSERVTLPEEGPEPSPSPVPSEQKP